MNTYIQVFVWKYIFYYLECIPKTEIPGSHRNYMLNTIFHFDEVGILKIKSNKSFEWQDEGRVPNSDTLYLLSNFIFTVVVR